MDWIIFLFKNYNLLHTFWTLSYSDDIPMSHSFNKPKKKALNLMDSQQSLLVKMGLIPYLSVR